MSDYTLRTIKTDNYWGRMVVCTFADGETANFHTMRKDLQDGSGRNLFKVLGPNLEPLHGGSTEWVIGEQRRETSVDICYTGLHLTPASHLSQWWKPGSRLFRAHVEGPIYWNGSEKAVAARVTLGEEFVLPEDFDFRDSMPDRGSSWHLQQEAGRQAAKELFPPELGYDFFLRHAPTNTPRWLIGLIKRALRVPDNHSRIWQIAARWDRAVQINRLERDLATLRFTPLPDEILNVRTIGMWIRKFGEIGTRGSSLELMTNQGVWEGHGYNRVHKYREVKDLTVTYNQRVEELFEESFARKLAEYHASRPYKKALDQWLGEAARTRAEIAFGLPAREDEALLKLMAEKGIPVPKPRKRRGR